MAMYGAYGEYGHSEMDDEEVTEDLSHLSHMPFSQVKEEWVNWLWPAYPAGGDYPAGWRSRVGQVVAHARSGGALSTGREMSDGVQGLVLRVVMSDGEVTIHDNGPAPILLLSAEDDPARTIRPRLLAAGANLEQVEMLGEVRTRNLATGRITTRPFQLPLDIQNLEDTIEAKNAALVVIDPLMAYLAPGVNSWRDQDVRAALAPLADVAERTWAAILSSAISIKRRDPAPSIEAAAPSASSARHVPGCWWQNRRMTPTTSGCWPPPRAILAHRCPRCATGWRRAKTAGLGRAYRGSIGWGN